MSHTCRRVTGSMPVVCKGQSQRDMNTSLMPCGNGPVEHDTNASSFMTNGRIPPEESDGPTYRFIEVDNLRVANEGNRNTESSLHATTVASCSHVRRFGQLHLLQELSASLSHCHQGPRHIFAFFCNGSLKTTTQSSSPSIPRAPLLTAVAS